MSALDWLRKLLFSGACQHPRSSIIMGRDRRGRKGLVCMDCTERVAERGRWMLCTVPDSVLDRKEGGEMRLETGLERAWREGTQELAQSHALRMEMFKPSWVRVLPEGIVCPFCRADYCEVDGHRCH